MTETVPDPIAQAITAATPHRYEVSRFESAPGGGVKGYVPDGMNARAVVVGRESWLTQNGIRLTADESEALRRAREVLASPYPLADCVAQTTALALFLTGLQRGDIEMIREGLRDVLVEPRRAGLIPGFGQVKQAALDHGALGASISGGGPSVFAWFESRALAEMAAPAMRRGFIDAGIEATAHLSAVDAAAARVLTAPG